ncbi:hypothetical protein MAR_022867, partial [Mya arenaria]
MDETYISLYEPETKLASMVWKHPSFPPKPRQKDPDQQHDTFFMDSQAMLLQQAVIRRDLMNAIRKKRPDAEVENNLFHQDNAPPHRCHETLMTINFLGPDLALFDFAILSRLNNFIRGNRNEDLHF